MISLFLGFIQKVISKIRVKKRGKVSTKDKVRATLKSGLFLLLGFIEGCVTAVASVFSGFIFMILLSGVLISFFFSSILINLLPDSVTTTPPQNNTTATGPAPAGAVLSWTDAELAQYGGKLTEYEKNLYRMGIFANKAIVGYDGTKQLNTANVDSAILFMIGICSIESSMVFYENGAMYDISKIPSDKGLNSSGYGFLGLSSNPLSSYYSSTYVNKVKSVYKPSGGYSYEAQYAPWGVAMSVKHCDQKYKAYILDVDSSVNLTALQKIDKQMDAWGVKSNREQVKDILSLCLVQAQYHGAHLVDHEAYINFWLAMYCATSDVDTERSFDKWTIAGDSFAESEFRYQVLGSTPYESVGYKSTPMELPTSPKKAVRIQLNGKDIGEPLWKFLWTKYSTDPKFQLCWSTVKKFRTKDNSYAVMLLNFHYGINSYLQGVKIRNLLATKMGIGIGGDANKIAKLLAESYKLLGLPYVFGGNDFTIIKEGKYENGKVTHGQFTGGIDCSAFTKYAFGTQGVTLPRTAYDQWASKVGTLITSKADLKLGDLIFFQNTYNSGCNPNISHVGIYIGGGLFIHEGGSGNHAYVQISNLNDAWWIPHYHSAKRLL